MKTTIQVGDLVRRFPRFEGQTVYLVAAVAPDGVWVRLVGAGDTLFAARSLMVLSKANGFNSDIVAGKTFI